VKADSVIIEGRQETTLFGFSVFSANIQKFWDRSAQASLTNIKDNGLAADETGSVLRPGEFPHMTADTGIRHSQFNLSKTSRASVRYAVRYADALLGRREGAVLARPGRSPGRRPPTAGPASRPITASDPARILVTIW